MGMIHCSESEEILDKTDHWCSLDGTGLSGWAQKRGRKLWAEKQEGGQEEEQCVLGTTDNIDGWGWGKGKGSLGHMVFDITLGSLDLTLNAIKNPDSFSGTS